MSERSCSTEAPKGAGGRCREVVPGVRALRNTCYTEVECIFDVRPYYSHKPAYIGLMRPGV